MKKIWLCALAIAGGCCVPEEREVPLFNIAVQCNCMMEEGLDVRELQAALDEAIASLRPRLVGRKGKEAAREVYDALFSERGFAYSTDEFPRDATIAGALIRRRGNCQAASLLYFVVAKELDLPAAIVLQPGHVHLRWYHAPYFDVDPVAREPIIEMGYYEKRTKMSAVDMKAFGYGRSLTDKETAGYFKAQLAHSYYVKGRVAECMEMLEEALAFWPGHTDFIIDRNIALECVPSRRCEAWEGYERLRSEWPGGEMEAAAITGLARMRAVEGKHEEALALLEEAMKKAPWYYKRAVALPMGWALMRLLRYDEARKVFEKGDMSEDEEAIAALYGGDAEKALELAACASGWRGGLAKAQALAACGRAGEALEIVRALKPPGEYADEYGVRLAAALLGCGKADEARAELEKALKASPGGRALVYAEGFVWPAEWRELIEGRRREIIGESISASR